MKEIPEVDVANFQLKVYNNDASLSFSDPFKLDLPAHTSLLAVSSEYDYTVLGTTLGFRVCKTSLLLDCLGNGKGNIQIPEEHCTSITLDEPISIIKISCDGFHIFACLQSGKIMVYDAIMVLNKSKQSPILTLSYGQVLLDLQPNPLALPELVALLFMDGTIKLVNYRENRVVNLAADCPKTAMNWSKKGKQIVCGDKEGRLMQYTPDGLVKHTIPPPSDLNNTHAVKHVEWLENKAFFVVYEPTSEDGPNDPVICIVTSEDSKNYSYSECFNICPLFGVEERENQYFTQYLCNCGEYENVLVVGSTQSTDISIIGFHQATNTWSSWLLPDGCNASLPLSKDDADTSIIGMAMNVASTVLLPPLNPAESEEKIPPVPILLFINNDAVMSAYHMMHLDASSKFEKLPIMVEPKAFPNASPVKLTQPESPNITPVATPTPLSRKVIGSATLEGSSILKVSDLAAAKLTPQESASKASLPSNSNALPNGKISNVTVESGHPERKRSSSQASNHAENLKKVEVSHDFTQISEAKVSEDVLDKAFSAQQEMYESDLKEVLNQLDDLKVMVSTLSTPGDVSSKDHWTFGNFMDFSKGVQSLDISVSDMINCLKGFKVSVLEFGSQLLKVEVMKEETGRFLKAVKDPSLSEMVQVRHLGPEQSNGQESIRKLMKVVSMLIRELDDHLECMEVFFKNKKFAKQSKTMSLESVRRTIRNFCMTVSKQQENLDQLAVDISKLTLTPKGSKVSPFHGSPRKTTPRTPPVPDLSEIRESVHALHSTKSPLSREDPTDLEIKVMEKCKLLLLKEKFRKNLKKRLLEHDFKSQKGMVAPLNTQAVSSSTGRGEAPNKLDSLLHMSSPFKACKVVQLTSTGECKKQELQEKLGTAAPVSKFVLGLSKESNLGASISTKNQPEPPKPTISKENDFGSSTLKLSQQHVTLVKSALVQPVIPKVQEPTALAKPVHVTSEESKKSSVLTTNNSIIPSTTTEVKKEVIKETKEEPKKVVPPLFGFPKAIDQPDEKKAVGGTLIKELKEEKNQATPELPKWTFPKVEKDSKTTTITTTDAGMKLQEKVEIKPKPFQLGGDSSFLFGKKPELQPTSQTSESQKSPILFSFANNKGETKGVKNEKDVLKTDDKFKLPSLLAKPLEEKKITGVTPSTVEAKHEESKNNITVAKESLSDKKASPNEVVSAIVAESPAEFDTTSISNEISAIKTIEADQSSLQQKAGGGAFMTSTPRSDYADEAMDEVMELDLNNANIGEPKSTTFAAPPIQSQQPMFGQPTLPNTSTGFLQPPIGFGNMITASQPVTGGLFGQGSTQIPSGSFGSGGFSSSTMTFGTSLKSGNNTAAPTFGTSTPLGGGATFGTPSSLGNASQPVFGSPTSLGGGVAFGTPSSLGGAVNSMAKPGMSGTSGGGAVFGSKFMNQGAPGAGSGFAAYANMSGGGNFLNTQQSQGSSTFGTSSGQSQSGSSAWGKSSFSGYR